jgi:hypothetical protein
MYDTGRFKYRGIISCSTKVRKIICVISTDRRFTYVVVFPGLIEKVEEFEDNSKRTK